jgi:hypothetical protein
MLPYLLQQLVSVDVQPGDAGVICMQVDREALPAMDVAKNGGAGDYVAPANPTEEAVQAAWENVLKISPISVTANYFQVRRQSAHGMLRCMLIDCETAVHTSIAC